MKKSILFLSLIFMSLASTNAQEITDAGALGVGIQATSLNYGLSGRYNLTEVHGLQLVIGSVNYGFAGNVSAFSATGRYLYTFGSNASNFKPYALGQVGFFTLKYKDTYWGTVVDDRETSISFGFGAGIEYAFEGLEQLGFNAEVGYGTGSFGNGLGYSGIFFGGGIHYYFNL